MGAEGTPCVSRRLVRLNQLVDQRLEFVLLFTSVLRVRRKSIAGLSSNVGSINIVICAVFFILRSTVQ